MYVYIYVYIYIYIHMYIHTFTRGMKRIWRRPRGDAAASAHLGAKYCTPEINTSEIIVAFRRHVPLDFQWHFPME